MDVFVRYQSPVPDRRGRRIGVFGLVNMLGQRGYLSAEEEEFRRTTNAWYDATYTNPSTVDPTVYVANLRGYHKTQEIAANPKVELCYLDDKHDQVRITGVAEVLTDRALLQDIWDTNPLLRQYLGSLDNPELIVYRVRPERVRFMREWALEYMDVPLGPAG